MTAGKIAQIKSFPIVSKSHIQALEVSLRHNLFAKLNRTLMTFITFIYVLIDRKKRKA